MRPIIKACDGGPKPRTLVPCWQKVLRQCRRRGVDEVCGPLTTTTTEPETTTTTEPPVPTTLGTIATTTTSTTQAAPVTTTTTSSTLVVSTTTSSTTTTTQDPTCAGPASAYVQRYAFFGNLVTESCVTVETPLTLNAQLHVLDTTAGGVLSAVVAIQSGQGLQPRYRIGLGGEATYPNWELSAAGLVGPDDALVVVTMNGLPREREGCHAVAGTVSWDGAGCDMRWEGTWVWFDN